MDTQYLERDGGRIAYDVAGDVVGGGGGPVVVCTPGLGENRREYRFLRPLLVQAGYRVVTMDLRGTGESTANFTDYTTPAVAGDVVALVRHLDVGPVVLLSNSYSGGPSLLAAVDAPELFTALVLTAPLARPQPAMNVVFKVAEWFVSHVTAGWIMYWSSLYTTQKPADFAVARKALAANMREPGHMAALRAMLAAGQAPAAQIADQVKCPVLIVMGTKDPDFKDPAGEAQGLAAMLSNATVRMVDGAGHYPGTEFPQVTADFVLPFLARAR